MNLPSGLLRLRIYTDHNDIYEKLVDDSKIFGSKTELFLTATVLGVLNNKASEKNPNSTNILDFIKLPDTTKELIYLMTEVTGPRNNDDTYHDVLKYADGGLALIWEAFRDQGTFDVTRLIEESKAKWHTRLEEMNIARETCTK